MDLVARTTDGVLLWQAACEFVAASRKLSGQGFTETHAWQRLAEFLALFPLILPTPAVLEPARALHDQQRWSFWDALLVSACLDSGVTRLYSEDLPGRKIDSLEIVSPFAEGGRDPASRDQPRPRTRAASSWYTFLSIASGRPRP